MNESCQKNRRGAWGHRRGGSRTLDAPARHGFRHGPDLRRSFGAVLTALLIGSCGGGSEPVTPPPSVPLDLAVPGMAVVKVRAGTDGVAVLEEKLTSLRESGPERQLTVLDNDGSVRGRYVATPGSSLVDFALHPSGQITVVLATARTVTLVRLDPSAVVLRDFPLIDPQAPNDPFFNQGGIHDDGSLLPVFTRDAVRVAPIGEGVAVARTGRNAVVAYRFEHASSGGYTRAWRTLVEPGLSLFGLGITSGSYDTFGQLENHFHVHVDADAAGNVAVAAIGRPGRRPCFRPTPTISTSRPASFRACWSLGSDPRDSAWARP